MLLRLAYLAVSHAFAALRLLPMSDREKDVEILVLRHQIADLERQLGGNRVTFTPEDRAVLAALAGAAASGVAASAEVARPPGHGAALAS